MRDRLYEQITREKFGLQHKTELAITGLDRNVDRRNRLAFATVATVFDPYSYDVPVCFIDRSPENPLIRRQIVRGRRRRSENYNHIGWASAYEVANQGPGQLTCGHTSDAQAVAPRGEFLFASDGRAGDASRKAVHAPQGPLCEPPPEAAQEESHPDRGAGLCR